MWRPATAEEARGAFAAACRREVYFEKKGMDRIMSSFLFVHFTGEGAEDGEQIYFSVSKDGMNWNDLNGGNPAEAGRPPDPRQAGR